WISPITVNDVVDGFNAGNFITVAVEIDRGIHRGGQIETMLAGAVRGYVWFHGLVAVGSMVWATLRLRPIVLTEGATPARTSAGSVRDALGLGIGNRPMIWKALVADARTRRGSWSLLLNGCLIAALLWPGVRVIHFFGRYSPGGPQDSMTN